MLSSLTAGVSFAPGDWSVTVPSISMPSPFVETLGDVDTVVAVCPLPKA
jgi:hypothetical protein